MQTKRPWLTTTTLLTSVLLTATACGADLPLFEEHDQEHEPPVISLEDARSIVEQAVVNCSTSQDTGYSGGNAFPITVVNVDGKPVELDTANAFWVMQQAAAADGVYITISSGFRTMAQQEYFYSCYINCNCNSCNLAATPGYSNHQSGHALDLNTSTPGVLNWLNNHGAYYGFTRTVPSENWHWEWWGGGPGGGICGIDPRCNGNPEWGGTCSGDVLSTCTNGVFNEGNCGAFGAQCSTAGGKAHCVHWSCWTNLDGGENGSFCKDDSIIATCDTGEYSEGNCAAYGASCSEEGGTAHCVHPYCPMNLDGEETGSYCKDDTVIATCNLGNYSEGNCGAYGGKCSDAGGSAHCVHYSCWTNLDGGENGSFCIDEQTVGSCTLGAFTESACPAGSPCVENENGAACGSPPSSPPPPPPVEEPSSGPGTDPVDDGIDDGTNDGTDDGADDGTDLGPTAEPGDNGGEPASPNVDDEQDEGTETLPPSVSSGCTQASASDPLVALFAFALLLVRRRRRRVA